VYFLLEEDRVVRLVRSLQFRQGFVTYVRGSQEPLVGAHGLIIDLTDFGAHPGLVDELCAMGLELVEKYKNGKRLDINWKNMGKWIIGRKKHERI
jgi:hypothetical protein